MTSRKVFDVCVVMDKLDKIAGQKGSWTLAQITAFSRGSRSTVDRQLRLAISWGWVEQEWYEYRGGQARRFSIAEAFRDVADIPF